MTDLHIRTSADLLALKPGFDPAAAWDIGRSTIGPVSIYTSWLPCHGVYETLVTAATWNAKMEAAFGELDGLRSHTREAARDMHASVVKQVRAVVDAWEGMVCHQDPMEAK